MLKVWGILNQSNMEKVVSVFPHGTICPELFSRPQGIRSKADLKTMRKEAQKNILNYTKLIFCIIEGEKIQRPSGVMHSRRLRRYSVPQRSAATVQPVSDYPSIFYSASNFSEVIL